MPTSDAFGDRATSPLGTGEPNLHEFADALPAQPPLSGKGTRASVSSLLLMGVDVGRFPFYKPTVHEGFRRALGLARLSTLPEIDPEGRI